MKHSLKGAAAMLGTRVLAGAALLSALVLAIAALDVGPVTSRAIAPAEIGHQGGHAFYIDATPAAPPAPFLVTAQPDSTGTPRISTLRLQEDGRNLGPAHSSHADIQQRGQGRYSHWSAGGQTALIFSTSDNSDPRANARSYVVRTLWLLAPGLHWLAWIVLFGSVVLLSVRLGASMQGRAAAIAAAADRLSPSSLTETQRVRAAWMVVGVALLLLVSDLLHLGPGASRVVAPQEIAHQAGHSYSFEPRIEGAVPFLTEVPTSSGTSPRRSRLRLYEDGRALGPAHSAHADVVSSGMGRFSHWGQQEVSAVVFSASDNTDPRTNGRRYTIRAAWQLTTVAFAAALVLFAAGLGYLYLHVAPGRQATRVVLVDWPSRRSFARIAVAGIAGFAALVWIGTIWGKVVIVYDSASYLTWSVAVPLGYPWFLAAVKALTGSYVWTPVVQILLLAGAIVYVCDALWPLLRVKALAILLAMALVCYTPAFRHAAIILTESVFISLVLVNAGAAFRLLDTPNRTNALVLAISAALVIFVRPAGYYVALGTLFLLIGWHSMARRVALMVGLPLAGCIAATALATTIVRGTPGQSHTGMILFPTVSLLFEPSYAAPEEAHIAREVYAVLQPHREALARLSGIEARYRHASDTFNTRAVDVWAALNKHVPFAWVDGTKELPKAGKALPTELHKWMNGIEFRFARATIGSKPIGYLDHVLTQIAGTWGWELFTSWGTTQDWFATQIDALNFQAVETIRYSRLDVPLAAVAPAPERFRTLPGRMLAVFDAGLAVMTSWRVLLVGIGALTFAAMFLALILRRRSPQWLALGYLGVLIHGAVFLIAAVTVMIPRYAMSIDPLVLARLSQLSTNTVAK